MKLSIVTINYNNAGGLEKTIKSIVCTDMVDYEYIVIDGGSNDGSIDIIKEHSSRITKWVSEPDNGIYDAMNKGITQAKGEYVLFINSGDIIHDIKFIHSIVHNLKETDFIYGNLRISGDGNDYIKTYPSNLDIKYFLEDSLPHTATFIRRELFDKYGFYNENMKICSDWAFFFKNICFGPCTYKHIDNCFSTFYSDGISSMPRNRELVWNERKAFIKNELPLIYNLYIDWINKKEELYRLKASRSIGFLKRIGCLKWFKT